MTIASHRFMTKTPNQNSSEVETSEEQREHLTAILEKMTDVMFVTYNSSEVSDRALPSTHGRPLRVSKLDSDGTMYFVVSRSSGKIDELMRDSRAVVIGSESSRWVCVHGSVTVDTDRQLLESMWTKMHDVWFPQGPSDPDACVLRFRSEDAEYWDNSGVRGVRYIYQATKALLTGQPPQTVKGQHGVVHGTH